MLAPWKIELLGWLRAEQDDLSVTRFATRQTAALLARLALGSPRWHSREELVELLWPEVDAALARARLRQALTSLRHQLEPPGTPAGSVLIADRNQIRLHPAAFTTDVAAFEAAIRAQRPGGARLLYRGDLLPGFYEDWIVLERERLRALYQACHEELESSPELPQAAAKEHHQMRLPLVFTKFFGRVGERAQLTGLLAEQPLITLTGPGGTGKTRLAIEVARSLSADYCVQFVGLADVRDRMRLESVVAERLALPPCDSDHALGQLVEALGALPTLLVLDNLEHLLAPASMLVAALLAQLPNLKILATSRQRLALSEEMALPLRPLPVPPEDLSLERLAAQPSVQLFVDRAQSVRPDFQLTARNAADVAKLCQKLEGLPLSVELAASHIARHSPAQLLERFSERFALLSTKKAPKEDRHRSLWATIAWSVELLSSPRRAVWSALAVFRGSFTVEAVVGITGEPAALDALSQFRERSLLSTEERGGVVRYYLLESLREFGQTLHSPEEWAALRTRHAEWYAHWAYELRPKLSQSQQDFYLEQAAADAENINEALRWSLEPEGDATVGLRLVAPLDKYWSLRGNYFVVCPTIEALLAHPDNQTPSWHRCLALIQLAHLERNRYTQRARQLYEQVLIESQAVDAGTMPASALLMLSSIAHEEGDLPRTRQLAERSLQEYERIAHLEGMSSARAFIAILAAESGDYAGARDALEQAIQTVKESGNLSGVAHHTRVIAPFYLRLNQREQAREAFRESLDGYISLRDQRGLAQLFEDFALELPTSEAKARLLGAAQAMKQQVGATATYTPDTPALEPLRAALGEEHFMAAWQEGAERPQSATIHETRRLLDQVFLS